MWHILLQLGAIQRERLLELQHQNYFHLQSLELTMLSKYESLHSALEFQINPDSKYSNSTHPLIQRFLV